MKLLYTTCTAGKRVDRLKSQITRIHWQVTVKSMAEIMQVIITKVNAEFPQISYSNSIANSIKYNLFDLSSNVF